MQVEPKNSIKLTKKKIRVLSCICYTWSFSNYMFLQKEKTLLFRVPAAVNEISAMEGISMG